MKKALLSATFLSALLIGFNLTTEAQAKNWNMSSDKECEHCTRPMSEWAGWYKNGSLKNRTYRNNGGLRAITIKPAKEIREIPTDIKPLPEDVLNFVMNRDTMSLMVMEDGVLVHDWARPFVKKGSQVINGESRSKSIVGVAIATMVCQNGIDLSKTHAYYSPEIAESYYGAVTVGASMNMMARDGSIVGYELKNIHRKKIDIVSKTNRYRKNLEFEGPKWFKYYNINTDLVMLDMFNILGGKKGFKQWFHKNVATPAGFKHRAKILLDKKGHAIGSSSIMLSRTDWMRFSMYVMQLMKDPDSCEGRMLHKAFDSAEDTGKKFAPEYAMFFWLNGYGVEDLIQMRGHGLRLSLIDWKNNRVIQTNGFAITWKPQELVNLLWN